MDKQHRLALSILLSAALHGGLVLAYLAAHPLPSSKQHPGTAAAPPLALRLIRPAPSGLATAHKHAPAAPAAVPAAPVPAAPAASTSPPVATPGATGRHFFAAAELTELPAPVRELIGDSLLIVPGVSPQSATVTLLIDDEGNVAQISYDADKLTDAERVLVSAALTALKFHPGKIGHISVHSKITIVFLLDSVINV